jgi:SAM-dependent methyltransferase
VRRSIPSGPPRDHGLERFDYSCLGHLDLGRHRWVLNLSAGNTTGRPDNVVEADVLRFPDTDVLLDTAARFPFADASFDYVLCLNAFEHYADPANAAREIHRILKPGAHALVHTAFLQPLHGDPNHYFNATKSGIGIWFRDFANVDIRVSQNLNPIIAFAWLASNLTWAMEHYSTPELTERFEAMTVKQISAFWTDPTVLDREVWQAFLALPEEMKERAAAGFEVVATKA